MKRTGLLLCALVVFACAKAGSPEPQQIKLWPDGPPESNGLSGPEAVSATGRVSNVTDPTITVYRPEAEKNTGVAVVICPGGGYSLLVIDGEGRDYARWLAQNGITGVVLKYRMPNCHSSVPLSDARQAMRLVRENAARWGIDSTKVGVMGFSAGGHLATTLITHFDPGSRPDFAIAAYPVVGFDKKYLREASGTYVNLIGGNKASRQLRDLYTNEKHVTPDTPPTMILFSDNDTVVKPTNGAAFYQALRENGVPAALHVYPSGGHGWGFDKNFRYHEPVKNAVLDWIGIHTSGNRKL